MAYEILSNPDKRKLYDQAGEQESKKVVQVVEAVSPATQWTFSTCFSVVVILS